jgi:hypothetical protein
MHFYTKERRLNWYLSSSTPGNMGIVCYGFCFVASSAMAGNWCKYFLHSNFKISKNILRILLFSAAASSLRTVLQQCLALHVISIDYDAPMIYFSKMDSFKPPPSSLSVQFQVQDDPLRTSYLPIVLFLALFFVDDFTIGRHPHLHLQASVVSNRLMTVFQPRESKHNMMTIDTIRQFGTL